MLLLASEEELQHLKTAITSGYLITEVAKEGLPGSLIIQGNGNEVFANLPTDLDTDITTVRIATDILWDRYKGQLQLDYQNITKLGRLCKSWGSYILAEEILKRLSAVDRIEAFTNGLGNSPIAIKVTNFLLQKYAHNSRQYTHTNHANTQTAISNGSCRDDNRNSQHTLTSDSTTQTSSPIQYHNNLAAHFSYNSNTENISTQTDQLDSTCRCYDSSLIHTTTIPPKRVPNTSNLALPSSPIQPTYSATSLGNYHNSKLPTTTQLTQIHEQNSSSRTDTSRSQHLPTHIHAAVTQSHAMTTHVNTTTTTSVQRKRKSGGIKPHQNNILRQLLSCNEITKTHRNAIPTQPNALITHIDTTTIQAHTKTVNTNMHSSFLTDTNCAQNKSRIDMSTQYNTLTTHIDTVPVHSLSEAVSTNALPHTVPFITDSAPNKPYSTRSTQKNTLNTQTATVPAQSLSDTVNTNIQTHKSSISHTGRVPYTTCSDISIPSNKPSHTAYRSVTTW